MEVSLESSPAFGGTGGFCQAVKRLYSEGAGLFAEKLQKI